MATKKEIVAELIDELLSPEYRRRLKEELFMADGEEYARKYTDALKTLTSAYKVLNDLGENDDQKDGTGIVLQIVPGRESILDELKDNKELSGQRRIDKAD